MLPEDVSTSICLTVTVHYFFQIGHALRDVKRVRRKQSRGECVERAQCGKVNTKQSSKGAEKLSVEQAPRLRVVNNKEEPWGFNPVLARAELLSAKRRQAFLQPSPSPSTSTDTKLACTDDDSMKCTSTTHVSQALSHIFMVNAVPPCDIYAIASEDDPLLSRSINTLVHDGGEDPYSVDLITRSIGILDLFPATSISEAPGGNDCLTFDAMLSALHSNAMLEDCDDGSINAVDELLQDHQHVAL